MATSWVIRDKTTKDVLFETFRRAAVERLNTEKYEAIPILEYLGNLNQEIATKSPSKDRGTP